jgi:hypothetical protein
MLVFRTEEWGSDREEEPYLGYVFADLSWFKNVLPLHAAGSGFFKGDALSELHQRVVDQASVCVVALLDF